MPSDSEPIASPTKAEIQKKIGKALEEKRKVRGWTLEKVGQNLKIRPSFIKALEDGDWQPLPGEVYGRGFTGRYAQLLGMDPKDLLSPYVDYMNTLGNKPVAAEDDQSSFEFSRSGFVWAGAALIVLVAIIRFITADLSTAKSANPKPVEQPIQEKSVVVSTHTASASTKTEAHHLSIYSPLPLWLSVKTESKSFEGFIPQAATWTWKADGNFKIRLGHTQQVMMMFDGKIISLEENQKKISLPNEN